MNALRRLLEAMSYHRDMAESKITSLGDPIREHLVKIYLFPNVTYVKRWEKELVAWYNKVSDISTNLKKGKSFTASQIDSFLYGEWYNPNRLRRLVESIIDLNEELTPEPYDLTTMHKVLSEVIAIISRCAVEDKDWPNVISILRRNS